MLDRSKVAYALNAMENTLFVDTSGYVKQAQKTWCEIADDPTFMYKAHEATTPWAVPTWQGRLDDVAVVDEQRSNYSVLAVDGSQIYPDRHQTAWCYLINVGSVLFDYRERHSHVTMSSTPYLFPLTTNDEDQLVTDVVNCKREELELKAGLEGSLMHDESDNFVCAFDGSLIFWHLDMKGEQLKEQFLGAYLTTLEQLRRQKITVASYISWPKSKELINLLRIKLSDFGRDTARAKLVDHVTDAALLWSVLEEGQRTTLFKTGSRVAQQYPDHLHPYFVYMHVGTEIVRIEMPAWVAYDPVHVDLVTRVFLDQARKGGGYPVCLAEAHEQAVVKGPDRDFFYHLLQRAGMPYHKSMAASPKLMKKRRMAI